MKQTCIHICNENEKENYRDTEKDDGERKEKDDVKRTENEDAPRNEQANDEEGICSTYRRVTSRKWFAGWPAPG
ncbi:hypothetical protein AMJ71_10870 [candidate division TA06 bacterium SM1_40]|uniref:Uncharacterized protein n=2 Tax=Bacteria division TA06 TaxID=1156500 RepID=A0A0S8J8K3_UNCT6|nr:MAG: hypothetical protein AMJ82_11305 [candidate division TA06 bacterium SM23_40]KPL05808.1 MAG: hypothetical protein AMJ71_10870 [candidate division TA06 bacterium SM1_40]